MIRLAILILVLFSRLPAHADLFGGLIRGRERSSIQSLYPKGTDGQVLTMNGSILEWSASGGGGSGSTEYTFKTISTTSGTSPVAESNADTLTVAAGAGITITGDSSTDTVTIASSLILNGDIAWTRTATAVDVNTTNEIIVGVTNTGAARTITLDTDDVADGRVVIVKDESGGAGTNNITIDTEGSETIDGVASIDITVDYGVLRVYSDGTNWFTF